MFYKWLRMLLLVFMTTLCFINLAYADTTLNPQEKTIFSIGENLSKVSFLISDILGNDKSMGEILVKEKLSSLQNLIITETKFDEKLNIPRKTRSLLDKFLKEVESSSKNGKYDQTKLTLANKTFSLYSKELSDIIKKNYGTKNVWLYDVAWLAGFTNTSMQSDSTSKLLLNNPALLENIPRDLPTSVISSLTAIATLQGNQLNPTQVELLKEASQNIITYFNDPKAYVPPVTMKDLVGKWEGRMSAPDGKYYKTSITINTDLNGSLNSEKIFNEPIPLRDLTLTQSAIAFDIKPMNDDKLVIRFIGRIVDDMMTGEAVDLSGKKGMWQFLKTTPAVVEPVKEDFIKNDSNALNKLLGTWKGKILEESGGISESTVYFNLVGDSVLMVKNENASQKLKIKSIAVNSSGIKFSIQPEDNKLDITFLGKVNGRLLEGNAKANDGTRAYWKLVKVSDDVPDEVDGAKLNYDNLKFDLNELCDPIVSNNTEEIILVARRKPVSSSIKKPEIPAKTLKEAMYVGYIQFEDGTKAEVKFNYNKTNPEIFIKGLEEDSNLPLSLENIKVTDREISFKTTLNNKEDTEVTFKAQYYDNYIYGKAINSSGKELNWEAISSDLATTLIPPSDDARKNKISGTWKGKANFAELVYLPIVLNSNDTLPTIKIGDAEPLSVLKMQQKDNNLSFEASKDKNSVEIISLNAVLDGNKLKGKINNPDGSSLNVNLELEKNIDTKKLTGLWHGKVTSGKYNADVVLDFLSNKGKIFIDDSKAKSGRLELQIKDLVDKDNKIKFKAFSRQTALPIEVTLDKNGSDFKGYMKNQINSSQKLNLSLNTSDLVDYFAKNKISSNSVAVNKTDNNLALANNKPAESNKNELNANKTDAENVDTKTSISENSVEASNENLKTKPNDKKEEIKLENTETKSTSPENSLENPKNEVETKTVDQVDQKEDSKKENIDIAKPEVPDKADKNNIDNNKKSDTEKVTPEVTASKSITDEDMYDKKEVTQANKVQEEIDKNKTEDKSLFKPDKESNVSEAKPEENNKPEITRQNEQIASTSTSTTVENNEKLKPADENIIKEEQKLIKIDVKDLLGKWSGELTDPQKEKGAIVLEITGVENYMYVDHSGEQVPFKLFDLNFEGKRISFKIKPSPEIESGIVFTGSLIEGVLSGDAVDPNGGKGKWYAKRL